MLVKRTALLAALPLALGACSSSGEPTAAPTVTATATVVLPPQASTAIATPTADPARFIAELRTSSPFKTYTDDGMIEVGGLVCDRFRDTSQGVSQVESWLKRWSHWTRSMSHFFVATAGNNLCSYEYAIAPD